MPRYDDRAGPTRLYIGHISRRTRSRDIEDIFSKYGRIRDVDMKHDFAFIDFSDSRDADDARHYLNGRTVDGNRIVVEFAKRGPKGSSGDRDGGRHYAGRGPTPGTGRCYNCGHDGHWARDCKAGDWKNKCYRCGQQGHIEQNCHNSPRINTNGSRSRSPEGGRQRSRSRSYSPRRNNYSRSPRKDTAKSAEPKQKKLSRSENQSRSRSPPQRNNYEKSERSLSRSPSQSRSRSHSPHQRKRSSSPLPHNGDNSRKNSSRSPPRSDQNGPHGKHYHSGARDNDDHNRKSSDDRSNSKSPIRNTELQDYTLPTQNGQSPGHSDESQESAE